MFACLDPCTWQGREYDNHSTSLSRINPSQLDTDQWCEVALSWGAREILYVAKHTGGFCWWQTETSDYSIRKTPYKNGKGDVLRELSESCRKYGLNLGIYVYPGDDTWGARAGLDWIPKKATWAGVQCNTTAFSMHRCFGLLQGSSSTKMYSLAPIISSEWLVQLLM